jgi:hypothetical protein
MRDLQYRGLSGGLIWLWLRQNADYPPDLGKNSFFKSGHLIPNQKNTLQRQFKPFVRVKSIGNEYTVSKVGRYHSLSGLDR